ncbi:tandem-95 repeat protein [Methylobacterium oxalidis]|uniref:Tandem-95 repeat protein n=1 Tax=Methylobacterium oxalidis TaxID=944322 RepID=A0A512JBW8_9HYPH|nr:tandem-95 repeat protein [Methylobacterium oxalidis]GEP07446.1 hypothetical protein MOX02_54840 [Methylobacterium oxalidis]GJE32571.1 hypothetical protein LDDCCGHA_2758 [Methylobacterium oxalidis]GLS63827.1 hypothetical protein GCM10007888_22080 [Methylobacterium oxalidis]
MKTVADIRAFPKGPGFGFADLREITAESDGTIRVDDAALLFRGHYVRDGSDLIVSDESHRLVVHDYFEVGRRPKLVAPDGATLSDAVIAALSLPLGGEQHAQAGAPQASDASPAIGRVQTVTGTATVVRNGVTVTLHVGDLVFKGDVVQTERGSSLAISFLDGTLFSLSASARMLLNDMVYKVDGEGNSALFSLVQGSITFVAGKVAKTGDMKVSTPVATMGIRGTAVSVQIDADNGTTRLSVMTEPDGHTGRFEVYDRDDPSRLLFTVSDPGQAFVVSPNGPLQVKFEQFAKTPADFQAEAAIVQALFKTIAEAPRLPVFQGPSTGGGGGSSTEPNIVQPDSGPPAGSGTPNGPNGTPPVDPLSGTDSRGSGSAPPQTPLTGPSLPGGSTETDSLVLTPHTFTVVQGNALVAATVGQGVLGATAALIVAARAGAEAPMDGLSGGAVTLQGRYGTLWLREDGTYVYRADKAAALAEGQQGADVFTYRVQDRTGATATTTLTMDVTGVNDAPVSAGPVALAAAGEDQVHFISRADLLAGASDVDGDALQVTGLRVGSGGGTIEDLGDGRFAYRPAQDENGLVTLSYTITDGHGGSVAQTVQFDVTPVNDAPTVSGPALIGSVLEDTARILRLDDLLAGARDADGDPLAVTDLIVADGGGTIEDLGDGRFAYRPAQDANGPVTLAYAVADGHGGSVAQTAQLTLTPVNDAPVIRADATGASAAVTELRPNAPGAGTVLHTRTGTIAFADPDAGDVHAVTLTPDHAGYLGSLALGSVDEVSGTVGWTFTVADGALDFLDEGETRLQTYTVLIGDGHGGSVSQTITVTLTGSREGPVAVDDPDLRPSLLTNSGFGAAPDFAGWTTSTANSGNFLPGFYSPQVFVDRTGTHLSGADAAAVLAFAGTINTAGGTAWGPSIRSATFTAEAGDEIKFDWQLSSGEDHARGRGYLRDASNGQIVATVLEENSNVSGTTGLQTKTFVLPAAGSYYIEFQVGSYDSTFGQVVGAELVIDYAGVVPRIREDKPLVIQAADLLANDGDPSGLPIHLVSVAGTSAQGGSVRLNPDGSITYDPGTAHFHLGQGETATDSFVYTIANSAGDTATTTASFTVTGVNDAPTGGNDHILGTSDTLLFVPKSALLFNDSDPDLGDRLSVAGVTGAPLSAAGDGVLLTGTGNGEHVSYTLRDEHGAQAVQAVVNRSASTDLVGTANDEILVAAETTESLTGGGGRDVFVFASAAASHRITDFAAGAAGDAIDLTGLFGSDVVHENLGAFARIVATDGHLALQVGDGSGTSWHTLADLPNLPADSAAEVTLIWTDHLARLTTQVPLV